MNDCSTDPLARLWVVIVVVRLAMRDNARARYVVMASA